jgi:hypothetical protein
MGKAILPHDLSTPRFTLLICTCDAYADAWEPLFTLFRRYWPTLDVPIVLNAETATYQHEGFDIKCPQLYAGHPHPRSVTWSKLLHDGLSNIVETDLVLLFLEDFYLRSAVDTKRLDICVKLMEEDSRIANIQLTPCPPPFSPNEQHAWLLKRSKRSGQFYTWLFSLKAGLWRRDRLLHFLRNHESAWHFEKWGSIRGRRYPDDFYAVANVAGKPAILDYDHGLIRGKWKPTTIEFFKKEGIEIDPSVRGVIYSGWEPPKKRRDWFRTAWNIFRSLRP